MGWRRVAAVVAVAVAAGVVGSARGAEALTKPAKISFDEAGVLVVDGKKVFPITLTIVPGPDSKAPDGRSAYARFADDGVMFMRSGDGEWTEKTIEAEKAMQAAAAAGGLRCHPWLGWDLANIAPGDAEKEGKLRRVIEMFRSSPGMGLWKGADEPDWGNSHNEKHGRPEDVANVARIIRENDPDHPIWLVQAPRGTVASLKRYHEGWDVGGIDIYPVSYPPGVHTDKANKGLSMVGDYARMMREVAGGKPFWMTLQIAFSGTIKPGATLRMPTFPEQRFMAYESIINGARGLVYFGGGRPQSHNERDKALGFNWTYWDRVMVPLMEEVGPRSPILPALLAPDSSIKLTVTAENPPPRGVAVKADEVKGEKAATRKFVQDETTTDVSEIEWVVREAGDEVYVLACKKERGTMRVRFGGLPESVKGVGGVVFEEPRTVEVKDGGFVDWFGPNEVHVYRFRKG